MKHTRLIRFWDVLHSTKFPTFQLFVPFLLLNAYFLMQKACSFYWKISLSYLPFSWLLLYIRIFFSKSTRTILILYLSLTFSFDFMFTGWLFIYDTVLSARVRFILCGRIVKKSVLCTFIKRIEWDSYEFIFHICISM